MFKTYPNKTSKHARLKEKRAKESEILLLSSEEDLEEGQTIRTVCPFCAGGGSVEVSMALTRRGLGVLYKCHRDSCGASGFVQTANAAPPEGLGSKKKFEPRVFTRPTEELNDAQIKYFFDKYGLSSDDLSRGGVLYCPVMDRYCFPCFTFERRVYAKNLRSYTGDSPKSLLYRETDYPLVSFYPAAKPGGGVLVLTEDQTSAIKVSKFAPACALLGTNLSWDKVNVISSNYRDVVIALDPGTEDGVIRMIKEWKMFFRNLTPVFLDKDPKDTALSKLKEELQS